MPQIHARAAAPALAIASGLAALFAQEPVGAWPFAFLVAPLLLGAILVAEDHDRGVARWGLVSGLVTNLIMLTWLIAPATAVAWALLSLIQASWLALFAIIVRRWIRSGWLIVVAPIAWTGIEAIRSTWPYTGFGWATLDVAHTSGSWLLPMARVLGGRGLTLVTVAAGTALFAAVLEMFDASRHAEGTVAQRILASLNHGQRHAGVGVAILAVGTLTRIGAPAPTGTLDILALQGNDREVYDVSGREADRIIVDQLLEGTRAAIAADGPADLVVWPEYSIDRDVTEPTGADLAEPVRQAVALTEGRLLAGVRREVAGENTYSNTLTLFGDDLTTVDRYVKNKPVPFGEFIPKRSWFDWFEPLAQVPRDAIAGEPHAVRVAPDVHAAVLICFETIFGDLARENILATPDGFGPAGVILAVTNDSSYGRSAESLQHIAQSRLRAVETGRWVVHSALSGQSALIDPEGNVHQQTDLFTLETIRADVPIVTDRTPFLVIGDLVGMLTRWVTIALIAESLVTWVRRRRGVGNGTAPAVR